MVTQNKQRKTTAKRTALWRFKQLSTIRGTIIQRAGRLTRPQGKLKLTMSANEATKKEIMHFLNAIVKAA
jgi:hypothetical protein